MPSKTLGELLEEAAAPPASTPPVNELWSRGRHRRARRRAGGWLTAVAGLAAAAVVTIAVIDNDQRVQTVAPPDAVQTVSLAKSHLSFTLHDSWNLAQHSLTPNLGGEVFEVFSAATYSMEAGGAKCAHIPAAALDHMSRSDAFVSLQERGTIDSSFPARPANFPGDSPMNPPNGDLRECLTQSPSGRFDYWWISFSDNGRGFYAIVAIGVAATPQTRDQAWALLDSLRIDPTSASTTTVTTTPATVALPGAATGITRPFVDPGICEAVSATQGVSNDITLTLFALSREDPIPIQIIGSPSDGPMKPFALVERFFTSEFAVAGQHMININGDTVAVSAFPNGNGEARWRLADGSRGYLRSRGLDLAAVEAVVKGLSPRDRQSPIPGFDYHPGAGDPLGLELLHQHLNTHVVGNAPTLECHVTTSDYVYRISAVHGDPVYVYAAVIDRPPPLQVSIQGGTVIIINGVADPKAPTATDVVNADLDTWAKLLATPKQ